MVGKITPADCRSALEFETIRNLATLLLNGIEIKCGQMFPSGWCPRSRRRLYVLANEEMLVAAIQWGWQNNLFAAQCCHVIARNPFAESFRGADFRYCHMTKEGELHLARKRDVFSQMNDQTIQSLFRQFNVRYFDSRLPRYKVQLDDYVTKLGETGSISRQKKLILISNHLSDSEMVSTLLHEMAHAAIRGGHTAKWFEEMDRLRREGAQLSSMDSAILAIGPEKPLSRASLGTLAVKWVPV